MTYLFVVKLIVLKPAFFIEGSFLKGFKVILFRGFQSDVGSRWGPDLEDRDSSSIAGFCEYHSVRKGKFGEVPLLQK